MSPLSPQATEDDAPPTIMFDPEAEGFAWPTETTIQNVAGASIVIRPDALLSAGRARNSDEHHKECYRLYQGSLGPMTELEIRYWQAGGVAAVADVLARIYGLLDQQGGHINLPDLVEMLADAEHPTIRIQITVRWLVTGGYLAFDPNTLTLHRADA